MVDHGFWMAPLLPKFDIPLHIKCKANAFTIDTSQWPCQHRDSRQIPRDSRGQLEAILREDDLRGSFE